MKFLKVSEEEFIKAEQKYVKSPTGFTDFNPYTYLDNLSKQFNTDIDNLSRIYFSDSNFSNVIFPETLNVLKKLKENFILGIFSEGYYDFQILKFHKTNILEFFDKEHTHICRRKLTQECLDSLEEGVVIVDDNKPVIDALCLTGKIRPIWIDRKSKEAHESCETIFDLTQLMDIVESR